VIICHSNNCKVIQWPLENYKELVNPKLVEEKEFNQKENKLIQKKFLKGERDRTKRYTRIGGKKEIHICEILQVHGRDKNLIT
jgi:hypothetical protein